MANYLSQAGPPIWVVLALSLVALVAAVRYLLARESRHAALAQGGAVAAVIAALLGTVIGFQKSVGGLKQVAADDRWIYLWGLKESLNNLVVALAVALVVAVLVMIGNHQRSNLAGAG